MGWDLGGGFRGAHVVIAVRDEVLYDLRGDEINKLRDDYGLSLNWWTSETVSLEHRLWLLMFKKIRKSMSGKENIDISNTKLWQRWFPFSIDGKDSWKFFFELTWARPRDLVRLLSLMQSSCRSSQHFSRECYDKIAKKYSQTAYDEISEELSTIFNEETAKKINRIIQKLGLNFTLEKFSEVATKDGIDNPEAVIEEMYRVGFIGNHYRLDNGYSKWRFAYRGDQSPEKTKPFEVHRALREALGIKASFNMEVFHENKIQDNSAFNLADIIRVSNKKK